MLKGPTQQPSVREHVLHDVTVSGESQMNEIEVLSDDLCARSGKVQRVRLLSAAQVVELENEMLRQIALVSPDNPSHSCVDQPEFVTTGVDRFNAGQFEVPLLPCLGVGEGCDEGTGSALTSQCLHYFLLLF